MSDGELLVFCQMSHGKLLRYFVGRLMVNYFGIYLDA